MHLTKDSSLGPFMTFEHSKQKPIHGWFWYKEGFAPAIVEYALRDYYDKNKCKANNLADPFCGVGTTLLTAKQHGVPSMGVDASPLAVFISKTKTSDYSDYDLDLLKLFLDKEWKESDLKWGFELFNPRAAFPKRNYNSILALREAIEQEKGAVRNLLLLALLSVLPQASIMVKDGGVLKIKKSKRALPLKEIFKRKVRKMIREIETGSHQCVPEVFLGDARSLDIQEENIDLIVTSPPYLNNIDYSKIYGLELSLLHLSKAEAEETRMRAIRSFIGTKMKVQEMPPEVGEIGRTIPIIGTYFKDMEQAMAEMFRLIRPGGLAHLIVSNSVIHETHVLVDEIFAEMAERIGFSDARIVVGAERIADVRPKKIKTRESVVVLRK